MRRLAYALAATVLGSGCVVDNGNPNGGAIFYWAFSTDTLGDVGQFGPPLSSGTLDCATAGVMTVAVSLDGGSSFTSFPCVGSGDVPGIWFQNEVPGTYSYVVEGLRGGLVVYGKSGSVTIPSGADAQVDARMTASYWDVVVPYTTPSCLAGDVFSFYVDDAASPYATFYSSGQGPNPNITIPCATSGSFTIPSLPSGQYTSEWALYDSTNTLVYRSCVFGFTQASTFSPTISPPVPVDATTCP
jgi:hypothetical protein